jgi:hypothetical protein
MGVTERGASGSPAEDTWGGGQPGPMAGNFSINNTIVFT